MVHPPILTTYTVLIKDSTMSSVLDPCYLMNMEYGIELWCHIRIEECLAWFDQPWVDGHCIGQFRCQFGDLQSRREWIHWLLDGK
jgi:hypothetical protein